MLNVQRFSLQDRLEPRGGNEMSMERAKAHLKEFGLEDRIMEFESSSATVELAARTIECEEKQIVKTLSVMVGERPLVVLFSGTTRVHNGKFKRQFHAKPRFMTAEQLEQYIGHEIGGVCPFGLKTEVEVYLDESLRGLGTVYPAAGTEASAVRLSVEELEKVSRALGWVDVGKGTEEREDV